MSHRQGSGNVCKKPQYVKEVNYRREVQEKGPEGSEQEMKSSVSCCQGGFMEQAAYGWKI